MRLIWLIINDKILAGLISINRGRLRYRLTIWAGWPLTYRSSVFVYLPSLWITYIRRGLVQSHRGSSFAAECKNGICVSHYCYSSSSITAKEPDQRCFYLRLPNHVPSSLSLPPDCRPLPHYSSSIMWRVCPALLNYFIQEDDKLILWLTLRHLNRQEYHEAIII